MPFGHLVPFQPTPYSTVRLRLSITGLEYIAMNPSPNSSPIKFGTSGWRGLIADDFTFANVRLAVTAIADHVNSKTKNPTILVGYDPRFYSEEFSQLGGRHPQSARHPHTTMRYLYSHTGHCV